MDEHRIKYLLDRYAEKVATPAEEQELHTYFDKGDNEQLFLDKLSEWMHSREIKHTLPRQQADAMLNDILGVAKSPIMIRWRWAAAAAVLLLILAGGYFIEKNSAPKPVIAKKMAVPPQKEGTVLTLANGTRIVLDTAGKGLLTGQNAVLDSGQLSYRAGTAEKVDYNTVTTPKGRQFRIVLSDGTVAWLNAASSIRYPAAFAANERLVAIKGEVYFEVSRNAAAPFRVIVNQTTKIEVLGTSFNVNAYEDEDHLTTTLIDGSIRVKNQSDSVVLNPGQQALVAAKAMPDSAHPVTVLNNAAVAQVTAWKNGVFNFDNVDVPEAMRQLQRWYNIDVVYENGIPDIHFWGDIGRDLTLDEVLAILANAKLQFRVENGKKLIIMNK